MAVVKIIKIVKNGGKDKLGRKKPPKRKIILRCDYCDKERVVGFLNKLIKKNKHYCNASCFARSNDRKERRKPQIFICPICNEIFKFKAFFKKHLSDKHNKDINEVNYVNKYVDSKKTIDELYVEHILSGEWLLCACGCGEKIPNPRRGQKYIAGHAIRVHNNWGHNPRALMKSQEARRKAIREGRFVPWNKGLTKEVDERMNVIAKKVSKAFTNERKKAAAKNMRQVWADGKIVIKYGKETSQWKGGVSYVTSKLYSLTRLYSVWKKPILEKDGFVCQECKSTKNLQVHHDDITLSEIIMLIINQFKNYDPTIDGDKRKLTDLVINYHLENNVSGITLCKECHKKLHPSYNF